jgi:hypothetical protein
MKDKVKYQNRYGDEYIFTKQEDGTVLWEGTFDYYRYGINEDETGLMFIDPSGGPFISVGHPFRYLNSDNKISRLEWINNGTAVKITLES